MFMFAFGIVHFALASLRSLNDGTPITLPEDQKLRLLELGLIEVTNDGLVAVTELGRERLTSDR